MSRAAYEAYFRQAAPAGALFGVDISWYQAIKNGQLDRGAAEGYWADFGAWADFICPRTSYGGSGDDGAQALHFELAAEIDYQGALGVYHFVTAGPGPLANFENFMARSEPFVDQTQYDMLDYEAAPNAGAAAIDELCDRTQQKRQRPTLPYGGKGYLDEAGAITCPANRLWAAQYPPRSADAWSPTSSWSSNGAPLMPDQYGNVLPGVWQWQSQTPQHGSLDLDISTTPDAFGIGATGGDDMAQVPQDQWDNMVQKVDTLFWQFGNLKYFEAGSGNSVGFRLAHFLDLFSEGGLYDGRDTYNNAASNHTMLSDLGKAVASLAAVVSAPPGAVLPVDVDKLAAALAARLDIAGTVAKTLATAFAALLRAAQTGVGSAS